MTATQRGFSVAVLVLAAVGSAAGQNSLPSPWDPIALERSSPAAAPLPPANNLLLESSTPSLGEPDAQPLFDFKPANIKFDLPELMNILRDRRHEGWVLAAYPDPKTGRPLIGAGFSLDVPAREHPQLDLLNPNPFVEPSSAQLWQAAGLDPERLQRILNQYERNLSAWTKRGYRRKIRLNSLTPQVTEEEATRLLRISAVQAIYNARAYCRDFDRLTASQQMALAQLVFQMGVNLQEFVQFLDTLNGDVSSRDPSQSEADIDFNVEHWKTVQRALIESQWARRYSNRAATVIAMFDPAYGQNPEEAEQQIRATLHPAVVRRRRGRPAASLRVASYRRHPRRRPQKAARAEGKRKLT
ncbi:MAG TPA: hypothetical protein VGR96_00290 [Acidobacteriaceae bacterium]|nr:hypothetical protein [Acidobacteriaceae bacterium]